MAEESAVEAIALLKSHHRNVEELFDEFDGASGAATKQKFARRICTEQRVHVTSEDEIFHPAFRSRIAHDSLSEAYVEDDGTKVLVRDIKAGTLDDDRYDARIKLLPKESKHHVADKEIRSGGIVAPFHESDVDLAARRERP